MLKDTISNIFSQHKTNKNKQNKVIYYLNMTQMFDNNKYMFENVDLLEGNAYTELIWGWLLFNASKWF